MELAGFAVAAEIFETFANEAMKRIVNKQQKPTKYTQ